jgi:uncharacterized protein (DUF433 family)
MAVQRFETPKIGEGIFLTRDIANILGLKYEKVYPLMKGFWQSYTFGEQRNRAVNFYALIEFFVYYTLRKKGMSAQRIKKFHTQMSKDLGTKYPFAHHDIRTDYKNIWSKEFENLVKADGKRQFDFLPLLNNFLHKITYGANNLAQEFHPLGKEKDVVVHPAHQFGQPIVTGTNIKTKTIFSLHKGGEKSKFISELYNIPLKKVRDAIFFHKHAA